MTAAKKLGWHTAELGPAGHLTIESRSDSVLLSPMEVYMLLKWLYSQLEAIEADATRAQMEEGKQ